MYTKYKILVVGFLFFTFLSNCSKKDKISFSIGSNKNYKVSLPGIDTKKEDSLNFNLDKKVLPYINEWTAYDILFDKLFIGNRLEENMMNLKKDEIKEMFENLKKNPPIIISSKNIFSRISVLESNTLLLHNAINNNLSDSVYVRSLIKNMSISYHNLMKQIELKNEKQSQIILNN
jgi:hypothetical protein